MIHAPNDLAMPSFENLSLKTRRLVLRPLRDSDAPSILAMFTEPKFMEFCSAPMFESIDEAHALVARDFKFMSAGERIRLGMERVQDNALVGHCDLFDLNQKSKKAEIGYALHPAAWGQGYVNEALMALLGYGFSELDLNRIEAEIDPMNLNSAKVLDRIGFTKEGHLREHCVVNGKLTDSALYGLLRRDWKKCDEGAGAGQGPKI